VRSSTSPPTSPSPNCGEVLTGRRPGRRDDSSITIFDSVGFAIEDYAALRHLADAVAGTSYAGVADLIADPTDPKDLFALVARTPALTS
jgi:ornithine cyclodeaminase